MDQNNWKRREFLRAAGAGVPAVRLMGLAGSAVFAPAATFNTEKFTPIDLSHQFTASSSEFGPRERAKQWGDAATRADGLLRTAGGDQQVYGIPFRLGPADVLKKSWVVLSSDVHPWSAQKVEIPLGAAASYLCMAQFCDWHPNEQQLSVDMIEPVGQQLASAILVYEDGGQAVLPIRRRFEVYTPSLYVGTCFAALPGNSWGPGTLADAIAGGPDWDTTIKALTRRNLSIAKVWICALENPEPARKLKLLRLEAAAPDALVLCGLTLFHGRHDPLRRNRRSLYSITLPGHAPAGKDRWKVDIDLGLVARTYLLPEFQGEAWLHDPAAGMGDKPRSGEPTRLFAEITASPAATLTLRDEQTGAKYDFDLDRITPGHPLTAVQGGPRAEILEHNTTWIHGRILDAATGRPTAARLAFRSKDGRYIPPYGHRTEVNDIWFQDYGADVKVGDSSFAYVDGSFQVELPAGDVYVEITKGFEYNVTREKLSIAPGQRELDLRIHRHADLRAKGWVTADTHVHFLSPSTALLEAQAEGLNLVNLLAAQWGDLFTNVGDLPHGPLRSPDGDTMVWMGTENRQHLMGHIGLLGGHGEPVYPLSADGPNETFLGEPLWRTMAQWADACRKREGLTIGVHFPNPLAELPADIVLGKIDAVELYPRADGGFQALGYNDWYRYLNCGYRLTVAGGTDKMSAGTPVGGNRTYAFLGHDEFTFANWAKAVRQGRTFATSGPLLFLTVDGHTPGDEIHLRSGGGTVEVKAEASGYVPIHRLEIVFNGRVVASREEKSGVRQMAMTEKVTVPGPGWLAARCSSEISRISAARFGMNAHTSPVYLTVPGEELFSAPAITYMLSLVEGSYAYAKRLAVRPDDERFRQVLKVFEDARDHLQGRLKHGRA